LRACPSDAVSGEKKKPHRINQENCVHCRTCWDSCKFSSIKILPAAARNAGEAEIKYLAGMIEETGQKVEQLKSGGVQ
jgi:Fe-S-cluster-containing hydrogenase component 2